MSYLDRIRLTFSGDFQADVSTVNNDVRHYDNATFEPRFQLPSQGPVDNGWWHPAGSNAFRLLNCRVRRVHLPDGTVVGDPAVDPAVGLRLGGSTERVSGKLVDLDPQWQLASQIWGLEVQLVDANGTALLRGHFEPAAFRDILFGRQLGAGAVNGQGASSRFQSHLTGVTWAADEVLARSPFLVALKSAGAADRLSIRLTTFGYYTRSDVARFTLGTVIGVLGPVHEGEPRTFIAGRRFAPQNGQRTRDGVNFFDGRLDVEGPTALVDLSNAIPITDPFGTQRDLGALDLVALADDGLAEGQTVGDAQMAPLAVDLPYREPNWLADTGGLHAATLSAEQAAAAEGRPWALIVRAPGQPSRVLIRETHGGFHLRGEEFVQRVDAGSSAEIALWATRFGQPRPGAIVVTSSPGPISGQGGGNPNAPQQPTAPIPDINTPEDVLRFPSSVTLDASGRGRLRIETTELGEPRGYLDGQIYLLRYTLADAPGFVQHGLDFIILHVRSTYRPPDEPTWERDTQPILSQFGNLYPVMDQIVDLTSYDSVRDHRAIVALALALPLSDPNYMPVTRDLSAAKTDTLLKWLEERDEHGDFLLRRAPQEAAVVEAGPSLRAAPAAKLTPLAESLAAQQRAKGQGEPTDA